MDLIGRLTGQARSVIRAAHRLAADNRDDYVGTEHLLAALLQRSEESIGRVLQGSCDFDSLQRSSLELLHRDQSVPEAAEAVCTPAVHRVLAQAAREAETAPEGAIGPEHLLLGLCAEADSASGQLLRSCGLDLDVLRGLLDSGLGTANRDWSVQPATDSKKLRRFDPSIEEIRMVLHRPSPVVELPPGPPGADLALATPSDLALSQHLGSLLPAVLGLLLGTLVGAVWGTWRMLLCMAAGVIVGILRSGILGASAGAFAGYHLAQRLCHDSTEALVVILVCIFSGSCVSGWWHRLLPAPAARDEDN